MTVGGYSFRGSEVQGSAQPLAIGGGQYDRQKKRMNIEH
jgi:hypothetical protein